MQPQQKVLPGSYYAKLIGGILIALDFPKWFLRLNQWGLKRWTLKNAVSVFILVFTGSVIFQILTPIGESPDMAWVAITASLYASFVTSAAWIGHRRRVKMEKYHPAPF